MNEQEILENISKQTTYNKLIWYVDKKAPSSIHYVSFFNITLFKRIVIRFNYYIPTNSSFLSIKMVNKNKIKKLYTFYTNESGNDLNTRIYLHKIYNIINSSYPGRLPERYIHKT